MDKFVKVWNKKNLIVKSKYRFFPADMMLRAIFSDVYFNIKLSKKTIEKSCGAVLDIGSLYGNNLVPFSDRGWECFGTEVTDESVKIAKSSCSKQGIQAKIKLGFNRSLPFKDEKFDLLLSLSTIHYEENIKNIKESLNEFSRVLKSGGNAVIQTVAPKHILFKKSKKIKKNIYQLDWPEDFHKRHKKFFYFVENEKDFIKIALNYFSKVEVARCTEQYPNRCFDMWLFKLLK